MNTPTPASAPMTEEQKAERAIDALEARSDVWAAEINLFGMIENIMSPMRLNRNAPDDARESFAKRMREQADAIIRQAYVEGALWMLDERESALTAEVSHLKSELDRARKRGPSNDEENKFLSSLYGRVSIADDAEMTFPRGGLVWQLVYGCPAFASDQAASVIESYAYLLSEHITMTEATARLRLLRRAYSAALSPSDPSVGEKNG